MLVIILRAELAQTRRIDRAKSVIKKYEKEREGQRQKEDEQQLRDYDIKPKDWKKIERDRDILDYLEGEKEREGN